MSKDGKSGQLDSYYEYDNEGRMTNELYPNDQAAPYESPYLGYIYDAMGRLAEVRRKRKVPNDSITLASGATYGPGGELLGMSYLGYGETRTYNGLGQLTRIQAAGTGLPAFDEQYVFSGDQNNGRIGQAKDWVSGEEVNYQYDALNRLTRAETTGAGGWGQSFTYL
ncbi:MAG: hypothetical protein KIT09_36130 [Bryobacteraceae bacterium]|nr:hypothetical protein [Bryobacteraceae bacterium]